jgi:preprotein translocase subunit SecA
MIGTINKLLKKFIGDKSEKDLSEINPLVVKINEIGGGLTSKSIDELRDYSARLKQQISAQNSATRGRDCKSESSS